MPPEKQPEGEGGGDAWLATYGDMVTLLLTFFVMMYAQMSQAAASNEEMTRAQMEFYQNIAAAAGGVSVHTESSDTIKPLTSTGDDLMSREFVQAIASRVTSAEISTFEDRVLITLPGDILFASGEADVRREALADLEAIGDALVQVPGLVYVAGHTDSDPITGTDSVYRDNWDLSSARAASVVRVLEGFGVPRVAMRAVGCNDTVPRPAGHRRGEVYKAWQRRVELTVIPDGHSFDGGFSELGQDGKQLRSSHEADARTLIQDAFGELDVVPLPELDVSPLGSGEESVLNNLPAADAPPRPPGADAGGEPEP